MANYLKLHRKILQWGWYADINTTRLFIHCLLRANRFPGEWCGVKYDAGEFITSLETLSVETSLTVNQVRTAIKHLVSTGEITSKSQGKCRIITVNNWDQYQASDKDNNSEITKSSQDRHKVVTTDIDIKNIKEKEIKHIYGEYKHVRLTDKEYDKLVADYGEQEAKDAITFLDEYIERKGYKANSHYLCIRKWVFDAIKREKQQNQDKPKKSKMNDFNQRTYDFSVLEGEAYS